MLWMAKDSLDASSAELVVHPLSQVPLASEKYLLFMIIIVSLFFWKKKVS